MTPSPLIRRISLAIAVLSLLALAWTGFSGGLNQLSEAHTLGQKAQTASQFAYGMVSVTLAGGLASVVWGDTSVAIGMLSGGATFLVALALIWLLRVGARGPTSA